MPNLTLGTKSSLTDTIARFRDDFWAYATLCLKIRNKESQIVPLQAWEAQRLVHEAISKQLRETGKIRAIILKARQEGISTYVAGRFFRNLNLKSGQVAMVVADTLQRAGWLYGIYARYFDHLPGEIMPRRKAVTRERYLSFSHDSELSVRPSSDTEAGRAMTLTMLHASELAYWGPGSRDTWIALMQAVPFDSGEIIVESTAKGAGGLFHELWEEAQEEDSAWLPIFIPWWIHQEYEIAPDSVTLSKLAQDPDEFERQALGDGISFRGVLHKLSPRKLAWRRAVIVEKFGGNPETLGRDAVRAFQQEYPATAEEAFLVSGACFFDEERLRTLARGAVDPTIRGRLHLEDNMVRLEPNIRGFVRIYEAPTPEGHYVVGADTAEGKLVAARRTADSSELDRGDRDFSAGVVLRLPYRDKDHVHHPTAVVAEVHGRIAPEVFAEQVRLLGQYYSCGSTSQNTIRGKALVGVERSHSSGQTVLRLLREHYKYTPLFWHRQLNTLTRKRTTTLGWVTDGTTRMPMLDELAELVRQGSIDIPSQDIVREMVTFVLWDNGKPQADEGCHDDRVIALAIAAQMTREHRHGFANVQPLYTPEDTQTGM